MIGVGGAASTMLPLEAGDAGNGHPAPAWKALGSTLRASVVESLGTGHEGRKGASPELENGAIRRVLVTTNRLQKLVRGIFSRRDRGVKASLEGRE
jgi:hypothetical protein